MPSPASPFLHSPHQYRRPQRAAVADLDLDGDLDVVVRRINSICCPEFRLSILRGNGAGRVGTIPAPNRRFIAMGLEDLDGDGALDLFAINEPDPSTAFHVARGDGAGGFLAFETLLGIARTPEAAVATGDLDEDGSLDIILGTDG